jgi:hypothetical protein
MRHILDLFASVYLWWLTGRMRAIRKNCREYLGTEYDHGQ